MEDKISEKRVKKLSISDAKKIDEKTYKEVKKIKVGDFTIKIRQKFRPTEIDAMIGEILKASEQMVEQDINVQSVMAQYLMFMMVKYFTDVSGIPDEFNAQLDALMYLVDNGFMAPIVNSFPQEEVVKINKQIELVTNGIAMFSDQLNQQEIKEEN